MKLKPRKEPNGWHIVSTIYKPPSAGSVGSGMFDCTPYRTRQLCREAIRAEYARRVTGS